MPETRNRVRPRARGGRIPDAPRPELPDQVVMPLLDRIVRQSLDEDYRVVAERKAARARSRRRERIRQRGSQRPPKPPPPRVRPRRVAAVVMALFGVLVAIAAVQTSRNAPEANASRASLVEQIQARRATVARLQGRLVRLQTSVTGLRATASQTTEDRQVLAARIERIAVRSGYAAVRGPGVRIILDDTPDGDLTQVVRSSDIAMLVNGLWTAGAEAIAVNNTRITVLTAFSNVGPAIHLGGLPLVPPYILQVVGDPDTLAADLLDSTFGQRFYSLKDSLGFPYEIKSVQAMSLPASRLGKLRVVRLQDDEGGNRPDTENGVNVP